MSWVFSHSFEHCRVLRTSTPSFSARYGRTISESAFPRLRRLISHLSPPPPTISQPLMAMLETIGPLVPVALLWSRPVMQFITRAPLARRQESAYFAAKYSLVLMELVLPSVSTTIIEASRCSSFDGGERYLREQLTISCTSASRRTWEVYTSLCVLLYPIGIPTLLFTLLYLNRNEIRPVFEVLRDHDARGEDHAGEEQLARPTLTWQGSATISEMMLELSAKKGGGRPS